LQDAFRVSERRGCEVLGCHRSTHRYRSVRADDTPLRARIRDIAETRVRYGYQRVHTLLRREGWHVNHKRVHRIYREEGLNLRTKRPRRHVSGARRERCPVASTINEQWSMDFVADNLFDGRRIRVLTVVDNFTRECLAATPGQSLRGEDVVMVMERLRARRGTPQVIFCDNGSEFISKALDRWAYECNVTIHFSRPGKPTDNAMIESFNGTFRDECLNVHWFLSLNDAREKIDTWVDEYNGFRSHSALNELTPNEFVDRLNQRSEAEIA
jgi:putative transposase